MRSDPKLLSLEVVGTGKYAPEQAWWHDCSVDDFRRVLSQMDNDATLLLHAEVSGVIARVSSQLQAGLSSDLDWRRQAQLALGYFGQKKKLVIAHLQKQGGRINSEKKLKRDVLVSRVRAANEAGRHGEAIELILEWIDGRYLER